MDVVEFVEREYDAKLVDWQKTYLRTLNDLYEQGNVRIIVVPRGIGRMFTYFKLKELVHNGAPDDRQ